MAFGAPSWYDPLGFGSTAFGTASITPAYSGDTRRIRYVQFDVNAGTVAYRVDGNAAGTTTTGGHWKIAPATFYVDSDPALVRMASPGGTATVVFTYFG